MLSDAPPPIVLCAHEQVQAAEAALAQANAARLAGDYETAHCAAERALSADPQNADAWVELGLISAGAGQLDEARAAFAQALVIAPIYDDARLGLARIEFWSGDLDAARVWLNEIDPARQSDPEVAELRASLARAPVRDDAWRWDAFAAYSSLSHDIDSWREAYLALSYRSGARSIGVGVNHVERFGLSDLYGELSLGQQIKGGALALTLGGASDPTFKPKTSIGLAFDSAEFSGWALHAEAVLARYSVGDVDRFALGVTRRISDHFSAQAQGIVVRDETDEVRNGYGLGATWTPNDRFDTFLTWTDAPESSEGATVDVRSLGVFVGAQVTPDIRLRLGVLREMRDAFDRTETSLAVTKTF
jgi:YaiO family outer membrane protein